MSQIYGDSIGSHGSQFFDPRSPPVVKTRDQIIAEIMEEFEALLNSQISSMLANCRPKKIMDLVDKKRNSEGKANIAPKVLYDYYKERAKKRLLQHPSEMSSKLFTKFVTPTPSDLFPKQSLARVEPHVTYNVANKIGKKLYKSAGISKVSNIGKQSFIGETNIDSMSEQEKHIFFNDIQRVYLVGFIDELIAGGIEIAYMQNMRTRINTPGLSCSISEIFSLIHKYIQFKYNIASDTRITTSRRITTSEDLLEFISVGLQRLSAIISPYYQDESDFADFKIYLPMLREYIRLILKESNINLAGDSTGIANLIIGIIRQKICDFVRLSGDPSIVIRTSTLDNMKHFIREGVTSYLYSRGDIGQGGGNRRRIKKYKNRTIRRTSRRTSRRTKHRTNRYKIKNSKTRKMRKL